MPYSEIIPIHVEKITQNFYGQPQSYMANIIMSHFIFFCWFQRKIIFSDTSSYMIPNLSCVVYSTRFFKQHSLIHRIADLLIATSKFFTKHYFPHIYRKLSKNLCCQVILLKMKGTVRMKALICMKYTKISSVFYYIID